jgi:hypothetical protein
MQQKQDRHDEHQKLTDAKRAKLIEGGVPPEKRAV